jgi:hypothetical protein
MWFIPSRAPKRVPSAHLLPNYDEYFIGYKDRTAIGERIGHVKAGDRRRRQDLERRVSSTGSWLVDGSERSTRNGSSSTSCFGVASPQRKKNAVAAAGEAFSRFLDAPCEIRGLSR